MKEEIVKIVYFDGICGMCDWFVNLLVKIDYNKNLKLDPIHLVKMKILNSYYNLF